MDFDLARIYIRYYKQHAVVTATPGLINLMQAPTSIGPYKGIWYPVPVERAIRYDDRRLLVVQASNFIAVSPIGTGRVNWNGDLDYYLSMNGLDDAAFIIVMEPTPMGFSFRGVLDWVQYKKIDWEKYRGNSNI